MANLDLQILATIETVRANLDGQLNRVMALRQELFTLRKVTGSLKQPYDACKSMENQYHTHKQILQERVRLADETFADTVARVKKDIRVCEHLDLPDITRKLDSVDAAYGDLLAFKRTLDAAIRENKNIVAEIKALAQQEQSMISYYQTLAVPN